MRTIKLIFILSLLLIFVLNVNGQDFIRIGAAHDFNKNKVVETFSFDFNRTEKIDEKTARFLLFDKNNFYILPTSDVNIGDGVTSSENNVMVQINMGKAFYGNLTQSKDKLTTTAWNKAIEFNPSYNSDKQFTEKLAYGQLKLILNWLSQTHYNKTEVTSVKSVYSIAPGLFTNLGYRFSKSLSTDSLYSTVGAFLDCKARLLNSQKEETWIFKLYCNYYYMISDMAQLTNDKFAGIFKSSIDRLVLTNTYLGISYKYGNDNPNYKYVHVLELSAKIKY